MKNLKELSLLKKLMFRGKRNLYTGTGGRHYDHKCQASFMRRGYHEGGYEDTGFCKCRTTKQQFNVVR